MKLDFIIIGISKIEFSAYGKEEGLLADFALEKNRLKGRRGDYPLNSTHSAWIAKGAAQTVAGRIYFPAANIVSQHVDRIQRTAVVLKADK